MYCNKCGKQIPDKSEFCPYCGKRVTKSNKPAQPAKCWGVFNNVGYGLTIAGLVLFWLPIINLCLSIPGFVFACLAKKDIAGKEKQHKSYVMGLFGMILGTIALLVIVIVVPIVVSR